MADPTQIHQVAMNLITNAYHAMEDDGGTLTVTLKDVVITSDNLPDPELSPGPYICLTVADTGIGMGPLTKERIYDPYFTTKETDKGTGLGLSVVHGIIKNYNGVIAVRSEPGVGTEFNVYLPQVVSVVETKYEIKPVTVLTGNERILVVDDEEAITRMVKQMLEILGYEVTARYSSLDALEAFRAAPDKFDLVITDMTMPNMTGDKLTTQLKEIRPDIPVILCTGFSESVAVQKAKALGIDALLLKPIVRSELAETIRDVLDDDR